MAEVQILVLATTPPVEVWQRNDGGYVAECDCGWLFQHAARQVVAFIADEHRNTHVDSRVLARLVGNDG